MISKYLISFALHLIFFLCSTSICQSNGKHTTYHPAPTIDYNDYLHFDWIITGNQPMSFATITMLLESNVKPEKILWISDSFSPQLPTPLPSNKQVVNFLLSQKSLAQVTSTITQYKDNPANSVTPPELFEFAIKNLRIIVPSISTTIESLEYNASTKQYSFIWNSNEITTKHIVFVSPYYPTPITSAAAATLQEHYDFSDNDIVALIGQPDEQKIAINMLKEYAPNKIIAFFTDQKNTEKIVPEELKGYCQHYGITPNNNNSSIICVHYNAEESLAYMPLCTKIIYCPSANPNHLPECPNTPFFTTLHSYKMYAPNFFVLNPNDIAPSTSNEILAETITYCQNHVKQWLSSAKKHSKT